MREGVKCAGCVVPQAKARFCERGHVRAGSRKDDCDGGDRSGDPAYRSADRKTCNEQRRGNSSKVNGVAALAQFEYGEPSGARRHQRRKAGSLGAQPRGQHAALHQLARVQRDDEKKCKRREADGQAVQCATGGVPAPEHEGVRQ